MSRLGEKRADKGASSVDMEIVRMLQDAMMLQTLSVAPSDAMEW